MSDPERDEGPSALPFLIFAAVVVIVVIAVPLAQRWYECQQLAPVERLFTRGC